MFVFANICDVGKTVYG